MERELIGVGCTRRVYAEGEQVIKFPYNDAGKVQAAREYEVWQEEELRPYVAQIFEYNPETGIIKAERLHGCCYMRREHSEAWWYFPTQLLDMIGGDLLQVGYDGKGALKLFDYGSELCEKRKLNREQLDELWKYRLRLKV